MVPPTPLPEGGPSLARGLVAGEVTRDPVRSAPRRGRVRRWCYVAAGDGDTVVGAAVVHLGAVGVAFAFARVGGVCGTWEVKRPLARGVRVGEVPSGGASARTGRADVRVAPSGRIELDVPTAAGRLRACVRPSGAVTPAVLATRTPDDGWNVTQKAAGTPVTGEVELGNGPEVALTADAGAWSDWTSGRQDRRTRWLWAAGAGTAADGRRVGINASTGMNGREAGEDVVWWDGVPHALDLSRLRPSGDPATEPWELAGPGTSLALDPVGARGADEDLGVIVSRYVQPFGAWSGTLVDPAASRVDVRLAGVAEDHLAVW